MADQSAEMLQARIVKLERAGRRQTYILAGAILLLINVAVIDYVKPFSATPEATVLSVPPVTSMPATPPAIGKVTATELDIIDQTGNVVGTFTSTGVTLTGPAQQLVVTDGAKNQMTLSSTALKLIGDAPGIEMAKQDDPHAYGLRLSEAGMNVTDPNGAASIASDLFTMGQKRSHPAIIVSSTGNDPFLSLRDSSGETASLGDGTSNVDYKLHNGLFIDDAASATRIDLSIGGLSINDPSGQPRAQLGTAPPASTANAANNAGQ